MADPNESQRSVFSLTGKLSLGVIGLFIGIAALAGLLTAWIGEPWLSWIASTLLGVTLLAFGMPRILRSLSDTLVALADGMDSLRDNDFSVSIAERRKDDLGRLISSQNALGASLRVERQTLFQRELLLDTVIQSTDIALLLVNDFDRVVYSNTAARVLLNAGRPVNGLSFEELIQQMPSAFSEALSAGKDGLFTLDEPDPQTYHLSQSRFTLNAQPHELYLYKLLTQELSRQEVATWKKVIRVISHELNNSLAPISSLAHSGRKLIQKSAPEEQTTQVLETIEERAKHLKEFIERYAKFARLPSPRPASVAWGPFLDNLAATVPFTLIGEPPVNPIQMDASQMEQVMINLLKNAVDTGCNSEEISVRVSDTPALCLIEVSDQGGGMTDEVMQSALLPFYSTKSTGTGLGLPLCREIIEGHGGRLALSNVAGGLRVTISLPH